MGGRRDKKHKKNQPQQEKPKVPEPPTPQPPASDSETKGDDGKREIFKKPELAVPTLIVAVIVAVIYAGQLWEMDRTYSQIQTQWENEHRPWVGSGDIDLKPPTFFVYPQNLAPMGTQINLAIGIPIKNSGSSPAFHVETEVSGMMSDTIPAPPNLDTKMQLACRAADGNSKNVGGVLFPAIPETRPDYLIDIGSPLKITDVHRVWITICIAYSADTSGGKLHHTKIWMASWPIDGKPTRTGNMGQTLVYTLPITRWGVIRTEAD